MNKNAADRLALVQALAQENPNYAEILQLAHQIAREDPEFVRFSVDASHISRLGLELVSKQETAISELIKNAFDADAVNVDIVFKNTDTAGGTLEIIDSGLGMSREQLINGFMRISTSDKVTEPTSPKFGRQRAGRKGIGRFAAQRLGKQLTITTQQAHAEAAIQITIDWDEFSSGTELFMVESQIRLVPKMRSLGTTMRIEHLRESWSEAQIRRAFRYVSNLMQPFPLDRNFSAVDAGKNYIRDPGFKVAFYREEHDDLVEIASDEQNIFSHAIAHISGVVGEDGQAAITLTSARHRIKDETILMDQRLKSLESGGYEKYDKLNGVKFTAHYFIADELPPGTRSMVRELLTRTGGIRVYRNGFRVLPYGESYDDWLGLQRSSALRRILPPHHNTNFLGFVEISDIDGARFEETASREGLIENEAFLQLQDFVHKSLLACVIHIANARSKKVFASAKGRPRLKRLEEEDDAPPNSLVSQASIVAEKLRDIAEQNASTTDLSAIETPRESSSLLLELAEEVARIGHDSQAMLEEVGMLRVLASLGLTIGEFTHEVRHVLAALTISLGAAKITGESGEQLGEYVRLLTSYTRYFDQAVAQNAQRKLEAHELRDVINEFVEIMRPTLRRQKVEISLKFDGYDLFTQPMHKSEWASTFLNLFTNSLKAIQRAKTKGGKIHILSRAVDENLQIDFSDNGDGIAVELRERIFEAFFTTSAPSNALSAQSEQITGTGLGLKIVRDIIEAANGEIEVVDPPEGYSTTVRITVPRASTDQIDHDKY